MARDEYFFAPPENFIYRDGELKKIIVSGEEFRHLKRVLRHQPGDRIHVTDGCGRLVEGEIRRIGSDQAEVAPLHLFSNVGEPEFQLTLAVCLPRLPRFELILEKGTEIGVSAFVPVVSRYSVVHPGAEKLPRWQRIVTAAMKQCGRSRLPQVRPPVALREFFAGLPQSVPRWVAHSPAPENGNAWSGATISSANGVLLIGPEGGFSSEEVELATKHGFQFVALGPRRLRTETAALVAAAWLLQQAGEFAPGREPHS